MKTIDQDSPWKDIIEALFKHFILFVSPEAYEEIDWSKRPKFLDKELRQVAPQFIVRKRIADILASVTLKDQTESWIVVHVEIQSHKDINFAERMYIYNHRIWERFKREVFSIAVLADSLPSWRPNSFSRGRWGLSVNMQFPILKLLDYHERVDELEKSSNPFSFIVLSAILLGKHSGSLFSRYKIGRELIKGLSNRGYPKRISIGILRFIDANIGMPEEWKEKLWQETEKELGHDRMTHYLPFEKRAMERGEEKGRQGAYIKAITTFLATRFGRKEAAPAIERLYGIEDVSALESLLKVTYKAKSVDEFLARYSKLHKADKKALDVPKKRKPKAAPKAKKA